MPIAIFSITILTLTLLTINMMNSRYESDSYIITNILIYLLTLTNFVLAMIHLIKYYR